MVCTLTFLQLKTSALTVRCCGVEINGLPVNSFELRGKYHKKNYFFSLGYEHLKIASPNYNFVTLGTGIYF
jgi:hypothetical protein